MRFRSSGSGSSDYKGVPLRLLCGPARSEPPVYQLLPQPLGELYPVAEVPTISALAANDSLSIRFRMAPCRAAKLLPEPQGGSVLAGVEGGSRHFFFASYSPRMLVPIRLIF